MFLSVKNIIHLNQSNPPDSQPEEDHSKEEEDKLHDIYFEYKQENGLKKHSCSIDRNQGKDISLMTEIVLKNKNTDLYPLPPVKKEPSVRAADLQLEVIEEENMQFSAVDINTLNVLKFTSPMTPQMKLQSPLTPRIAKGVNKMLN